MIQAELPGALGKPAHRRARVMLGVFLPVAAFYFAWLLWPGRVGNPILYGLLVGAELFNLAQALGFWWTCAHDAPQWRRVLGHAREPAVDVLIPVYDEPVEIVEPTIARAARLRGARAVVHLLDDGGSPEMEALAERHGVSYVRRPAHEGAKAGNLNHALDMTLGEFVVVFDCDHVPDESFLEKTLPYLEDPLVAYVQTPQYYANARTKGGLCAAAWGQQALFFGPISRGKDALGAMFCCGTNMVFRRSALEEIGGFPEASLTEDFEMSIDLHERGYKSVYIPEILTRGLGPEDEAAYAGQQHRWARGCLSALPRVIRARLPLRLRLQYLLSAAYFLTGLSIAIYVLLPVIRLLTGAQPLAAATADDFLLHFAPYFGLAILGVARFGSGLYSFDSFALMSANYWVHIRAVAGLLARRPARFTVTPKKGAEARQIRAAMPSLVMVALLIGAATYGLVRDREPATWNNVAFASLHATVLLTGIWPALTRPKDLPAADPRIPVEEREAATDGLTARPVEEAAAAGRSRPPRPIAGGADDGTDVDVVMLTWGRIGLALETLDSVLAQRDVSLRVWIVDQGSKEEDLAPLRARAAEDERVELTELGRNVGPPAGRNLAARKGVAPCIVTIDNDAIFATRDELKRVKQRFDREEGLGALAFRILNFTTLGEESWSYPQELRSLAHREFTAARFVTCGSALRRDVFERVGGFDERLFFCEEELDLALKLIDRGYRIVYDPRVTVLHKVAPERRVEWSDNRFYYQTRNALFIDYGFYRRPGRTLIRAAGYLTKSLYNRVPGQAVKGVADAVRMIRAHAPDGLPVPLSEPARRYVALHEDDYRGGLGNRVRNEVLVKMRGIR